MNSISSETPLRPESLIVLLCLAFQAGLVFLVTFGMPLLPDWFGGLYSLLAIGSTAIGLMFSIFAFQCRGLQNRAVGFVGVVWFEFLVVLWVVTTLRMQQ